MGGIGDFFVKQAITEQLVAGKKLRGVKTKAMKSKTRHSIITPGEVSHKFNIGIKKAKEKLRVSTQKWIRHAVHQLYHRYRVDNMQLNRKRINAQFYTDKLLDKSNSLKGNTGARIYTTGKFTVKYPCTNNSEVGDTLRRFANDVGIPDRLRSDLALEILGKNMVVQAQVKRLRIYLTHLEVELSNQNQAAEGDIGHMKKCFGKLLCPRKSLTAFGTMY